MYNDCDDIYSPIEELQKIENGGAFKRSSANIEGQPLGIKIIGYVMIGFMALMFLIVIFSNIFL
ncbi:hypothetical protein [Bacillus sp. JJ722]|uniref:hypothetical protein n=1 Tax=Bacillus sp. JJ722 TaxID=3122973 RepID=UPI002FFFB584